MNTAIKNFTHPIVGTMKSVLDHGFVRVVDVMGDDDAIVQAARVSYGDGTKKVNGNEGLIRYLMRHWHSTPFEMCEVKLHLKMPIFVARQWIRHRTANVNEISGRYSVLPNEFYIPAIEDIARQSTVNNQGRGEAYDYRVADDIQTFFLGQSMSAYEDYRLLVEEGDYADANGTGRKGYAVARELSRMVLPTNIYTEMYWKIDLHNLFHFLRLRADPHAQFEIREYANAICEIVKAWCPIAYKAFEDYRLNAGQFSAMEMQVVRDMFKRAYPLQLEEIASDLSELGCSKREVDEFFKTMHIERE